MRQSKTYIATAAALLMVLGAWAPGSLTAATAHGSNPRTAPESAIARSMWARTEQPLTVRPVARDAARQLSPAERMARDFVPRQAGRSVASTRPAAAPKSSLGTAPGWKAMQATRPSLAPDPQVAIDQVSCPKTNDCFAIGAYANRTGAFPGLLLHQSGQSWTAVQAPVPKNAAKDGYVDLYDIDCLTVSHCVAVGDYSDTPGSEGQDNADTRSLVETFQAGKWSPSTTPYPKNSDFHPGASLYSVACPTSAGCTAVGSYNVSGEAQPFIATGVKGVWKSQSAPAPSGGGGGFSGSGGNESGLTQVVCRAANECTAVGSYANDSNAGALFDQQVGGRWKALTVPKGGSAFLDSVGCLSASSCVAVGGLSSSDGNKLYGYAVTEKGGKLTGQKTPLPKDAPAKKVYEVDLYSVACASGSCTAVGDWAEGQSTVSGNSEETNIGPGVPLLLNYRNGAWSTPELPTDAQGGVGYLNLIACATSGSCVAVGVYAQQNGYSTLLMTGSGSHWLTQSVGGDAEFNYGELLGVSCQSACEAVGSYIDKAGNTQGMIVTSGKTGFEGKKAPLPSGAGAPQEIDMVQVSCAAAGTCVALGTNEDRSIVAETLSAGKWTVQVFPDPTTLGWGDAISPVSLTCWAAGHCVAIADYETVHGGSNAEILTDTNGSWTESPAPYPAGSSVVLAGGLEAVTCSAGNCVMAGWYVRADRHYSSWIISGAPGAWKAYTVAAPPKQTVGQQTELLAAGCSTDKRCTLVGLYGKTNHALPFVVRGSGSTWKPAVAPLASKLGSPAKINGFLQGVSCTSACVATGVADSSHGQAGLIDFFGRKKAQSTVTPSPSKQAYEVDVSTPSCRGTKCVIVGYFDGFNASRAIIVNGWAGSWKLVNPSSGKAPGNSTLGAVDCASLGDCEAVGGISTNGAGLNGNGTAEPLLAHDAGGKWTLGLAPLPAGAETSKNLEYAFLESVSCPGANACVAIGSYVDTSYTVQGLIEQQ